MTAAEIRAELVARLEAERFTAPQPRPQRWDEDPVTPEQAAVNRQILEDALSGDVVLMAWRDRGAA